MHIAATGEKALREAAFAAEAKAVSTRRLTLAKQTFFLQPMHFADFSEYEDRILKVTHTDHKLSPDGATFHMPIRVDLFEKTRE